MVSTPNVYLSIKVALENAPPVHSLHCAIPKCNNLETRVQQIQYFSSYMINLLLK
jgi:hypothetical protein